MAAIGLGDLAGEDWGMGSGGRPNMSAKASRVMVDESIHEEDGSDDDEKEENIKDDICQLLDQRTASQCRDKSCAPSH